MNTWSSGKSSGGRTIIGSIELVPTAASTALLLVAGGTAYILPLHSSGGHDHIDACHRVPGGRPLTDRPRLHAEGQDLFPVRDSGELDPASYLAIALGAGDYLSRRAREHAAGRVQFPGQMLDTQGRDGIAKLGAVKALVSRIEAWRLLLETLYRAAQRSHGATSPEFDALCASTAAMAFGPEPGCMAYDAGQVFGGFAFSEDDLLARFYRDSALFRFLAPGHGASADLQECLSGTDLGEALSGELGSSRVSTAHPLRP